MASLREQQLAAQINQRKSMAQRAGGEAGKKAGQAGGGAAGAAVGGAAGVGAGGTAGAVRGAFVGAAAGGVGAIPGAFIGAGQGAAQYGAKGAKSGQKAGSAIGGTVGKQAGKKAGSTAANIANRKDQQRLNLARNKKQDESLRKKTTKALGVNRHKSAAQRARGAAGGLIGGTAGSWIPIVGTSAGSFIGRAIGNSILGKWIMIGTLVLGAISFLVVTVSIIGALMAICEYDGAVGAAKEGAKGSAVGALSGPGGAGAGAIVGAIKGYNEGGMEICEMFK